MSSNARSPDKTITLMPPLMKGAVALTVAATAGFLIGIYARPSKVAASGPSRTETKRWIEERLPELSSANYQYTFVGPQGLRGNPNYVTATVQNVRLDDCTLAFRKVNSVRHEAGMVTSVTTDYTIPLTSVDMSMSSVRSETSSSTSGTSLEITENWSAVVETKAKAKGIRAADTSGAESMRSEAWIPAQSQDAGNRMIGALRRAAEFCGYKAEPF